MNVTIPSPIQAGVTLLVTTDLHMHTMPFDYYSDRPSDAYGIARTATLIRRLRAEAVENNQLCLLFDNGDTLQGTPMADCFAHQIETGLDGPEIEDHPLIKVMNALQYDGATLGNHDFDYGLDFLYRATSMADFPIVLSNIKGSVPETISPHRILERTVTDSTGVRHVLRIGLLGVVPPQTAKWDSHALQGRVRTGDCVTAAAKAVAQLRADRADIVIALAHTGVGAPNYTPMMENAALPIAGLVGVDAVIAGHTHLRLPGPDHAKYPGVDTEASTLHNTPAIMAGANGAYLGQLDLTLERRNGRWSVGGHMAKLWPIAERKPCGTLTPLVKDDPEIASLLEPAHAMTQTQMGAPVAENTKPLHSYFAHVFDSPALRVVAQAQACLVAEMLGHSPDGTLPILSAVPPHKSGGRSGPDYYTDVPQGMMCRRHISDLQIFPNQVWAVRVDGKELREWLEMSASLFHQIDPQKSDQPLVNKDMPGYNFDVIYGLKYQIDLTVPARYSPDGSLANPSANRIISLRCGQVPVDDEQTFVVALSNYRANGGGNFPGFERPDLVLRAPFTTREQIVRNFEQPPGQIWSETPPWQFCPTGTRVTFETGPGAHEYLDDVAHLEPEVRGLTPDGFLQLALTI